MSVPRTGLGKGPEYSGIGRREVNPIALIFTAYLVQTQMRKPGAAPCPVEGDMEAVGAVLALTSRCHAPDFP